MKTVVVPILLLLALTAPTLPAQPQCLVGPSGGSSLLFPYFEVDLEDPDGVNTLLAIGNSSVATPRMVRVVLWTDWASPTVAFDVYLASLDLQTISVRDILNGAIPSTGAGVNLSAFAGCVSEPPSHANPALSSSQIAQLRADHTGVDGPIFSDCVGENHGDGIARGYVTADVVDQCSGLEGQAPLVTPRAASYFANGGSSAGVAIISNTLWGDVLYVDPANNGAQGTEAVALWADASFFSGSRIYTFYGAQSSWDGRDERVPLPYSWRARFFNGGPFDGGADLIVWRDIGRRSSPASCTSRPPWYPLRSINYTLDEDGADYYTPSNAAFPLATQRVSIDALSIPYDFGQISIADGSPEFGQLWVQPVLTARPRYSVGLNGSAFGFLCGLTPP